MMRPHFGRLQVLLLHLLFFSQFCTAIYFYVEPGKPECIYEDVPRGTLLVGKIRADWYDQQQKHYIDDSTLKIRTVVYETFDRDHAIVSKMSIVAGQFEFTAEESGMHRVCFEVSTARAAGWNEKVRLHLEITAGASSALDASNKETIEYISHVVNDLTLRLHDIRREQVYHRQREAEFRDQSERTNSGVVKWSIIQIAVLIASCAWQMSHLQTFFTKQKLV